jgi:hypothetical protein
MDLGGVELSPSMAHTGCAPVSTPGVEDDIIYVGHIAPIQIRARDIGEDEGQATWWLRVAVPKLLQCRQGPLLPVGTSVQTDDLRLAVPSQ